MSLSCEDAILRACALYTLSAGSGVLDRGSQYGPELFPMRNIADPKEPVIGWAAKLGDYHGQGVSVKAALNALVDALEAGCERMVSYHQGALQELAKEGFRLDDSPNEEPHDGNDYRAGLAE